MSKHKSKYSSGYWRRLRQAVLIRDGYRCRQCGRAGRMEVDHVVPFKAGGSNALSNLQSLCRACHFRKTGGENEKVKGRQEWTRRVEAHAKR